MLILNDQTPVAQGRMRSVYRHPADPGLVIKIIRPEVIDVRWGSGQPWYKSRRRFGQYISYMREISEYIAMHARYGRSLPFAQKIVGFEETDFGLGLVTAAALDREGGLATPLAVQMMDGRFNEHEQAALKRFLHQVRETEMIIADLNAGNMVYSWSASEGWHYVLIDGIGLSSLLPIKAVFPSINHKSKLARIERICRKVNRRRTTDGVPFELIAEDQVGQADVTIDDSRESETRHLLELKSREPLAKGSVRLVFAHPGSPELLVKVMRRDLVESRYGEGAAWFRRGRRHDPYVVFLREIAEYVASYASHGHSLPFAQKVCGLVETDFGLGLVTEAAHGPDGNLAPTLAKLIQVGEFDPQAVAALDEFLDGLLESDLVLADLHERNIVYACCGDGRRHFVMIDGLGSSNFIKSWSRALNRRSKLKRIVRLRKRIASRVAAFLDGNPRP